MITRNLAVGLAGFALAGAALSTTSSARADEAPPAATTAPTTTEAAPPLPPATASTAAAAPPATDTKSSAAAPEAAAGAPGGAAPAPAAATEAPPAVVVVTGDETGTGQKDEIVKGNTPADAVAKKNAFAGSLLLFDQSITTNSLSKGSQLSYSPLYEWWISPRLYYSVGKVKFGARFDFFKEMFTNHDETTDAREWVVGDPWLTASYGDQASFLNKHPKSRFAVGVLARPPLSKDSRGNGQYLSAGPTASLSWGFDVAGAKSKFFQTASLGLYASYSHAFTKSTTPQPFNGYNRGATYADGTIGFDSQVRSGTLAGNSLIYSVNGDIDILENLSFGASMIWIDQFSYQPPDVAFAGQPVAHSANDTRFRQLTWFLTSLDYEPIKELGVSVGYYNLASSIAPDGSRRNVLWSPDARLFLSLTAHLDAIYDDATKKPAPAATAVSNFRAFN